MSPRALVAVAAGGAAGAGLRWSLVELADSDAAWPWAVFLANLIGCGLLGYVVGAHRRAAATDLYLAATTGFCGALTTFSTFAVDIALLARDDDWVLAVAYLATSLALGTLAFAAARFAGAASSRSTAP